VVRGFTFVEFIVIISIFAIMASIALFNFRGFRTSVRTNNLVYDVALQIKSAQTLGVSAPGELDASVGGGFEQVVTTMFDYTGGTTGFSPTFITFRDVYGGGKGVYDAGIDVIIHTSTLVGGYPARIEVCTSSTSCTAVNSSVSISFQRPDPEPVITSSDCSGPLAGGYLYPMCEGAVRIAIVAEDAPSKVQYIYVEPTGQIRVASS
jgi:type II secretory pathway pseudopilin PulG